MKNCTNCESWNWSVFRPHCNCFGVAIKSDACGNLYPVTQCMKREEYRAMLAQYAAEHPAPRSLVSRLFGPFFKSNTLDSPLKQSLSTTRF